MRKRRQQKGRRGWFRGRVGRSVWGGSLRPAQDEAAALCTLGGKSPLVTSSQWGMLSPGGGVHTGAHTCLHVHTHTHTPHRHAPHILQEVEIKLSRLLSLDSFWYNSASVFWAPTVRLRVGHWTKVSQKQERGFRNSSATSPPSGEGLASRPQVCWWLKRPHQGQIKLSDLENFV